MSGESFAQGPASDAQTRPAPGMEGRIAAYLLQQQNIPGLATGVSVRGKRYFHSYGVTGESGESFSPDTLVEIGAITKVFTSTLFTQAVIQGRMALDDPIQNYMPEGTRLTPAAQNITLAELADYTSGLPRLLGNPTAGAADGNGFRPPTTSDFFGFLSGWTPMQSPPSPYRSSYLSMGLLGYLVAETEQGDWNDLLKEQITQPLRLDDTVLQLSEEQNLRLAQGFGRNGLPAPKQPEFPWYAADGLRSTVQDMLQFAEANMGRLPAEAGGVSQDLIAAMKEAREPRYQPRGRNFEQALGWMILPADPAKDLPEVIYANGGTPGFSSTLALIPSRDIAIFIVANRKSVNTMKIGMRILGNILR